MEMKTRNSTFLNKIIQKQEKFTHIFNFIFTDNEQNKTIKKFNYYILHMYIHTIFMV